MAQVTRGGFLVTLQTAPGKGPLLRPQPLQALRQNFLQPSKSVANNGGSYGCPTNACGAGGSTGFHASTTRPHLILSIPGTRRGPVAGVGTEPAQAQGAPRPVAATKLVPLTPAYENTMTVPASAAPDLRRALINRPDISPNKQKSKTEQNKELLERRTAPAPHCPVIPSPPRQPGSPSTCLIRSRALQASEPRVRRCNYARQRGRDDSSHSGDCSLVRD